MVEVSYAQFITHFTIRGRDGSKIHVDKQISGVPTLIEALQAKLPPRLYHQALHTFWRMPAVAPKNDVISLMHDPITFDTSGWRTHEDQAYRRVWTGDAGDMLRLRLIEDRPRLPASLEDVDALRVFFRGLIVDKGGALISLECVNLDGVPAIQWIAKFPQRPHGLVYVGFFIIPFRDLHYTMRVLCRERDLTGYREAVGLDRLLGEGVLEPGQEGTQPQGWQADPYDPAFDAPLLCNLSEDEEYDAAFPEHPLSWLRETMRDIAATLRFSFAVKRQPPFTGPAYR